jgi:hypothetical protein
MFIHIRATLRNNTGQKQTILTLFYSTVYRCELSSSSVCQLVSNNNYYSGRRHKRFRTIFPIIFNDILIYLPRCDVSKHNYLYQVYIIKMNTWNHISVGKNELKMVQTFGYKFAI